MKDQQLVLGLGTAGLIIEVANLLPPSRDASPEGLKARERGNKSRINLRTTDVEEENKNSWAIYSF